MGTIYIAINTKHACEKYYLQGSNLNKVAIGERKHHKGYKMRYV
jgi:hypothetical protein